MIVVGRAVDNEREKRKERGTQEFDDAARRKVSYSRSGCSFERLAI